jgi:tetratricopeptide (TPR) repeat protein
VTPGPDPQALYAQAHDLHFHGHDPARALAAWDRYLAAASRDIRSGLVLEARYNRAICLFRLGQREEARQALQPFADGRWGDYRRDDAQALLDELERR